MKCRHCLIEFHPKEQIDPIQQEDADGGWYIQTYLCPNCNHNNIFLVNATDITISRTVYKHKNVVKIIPIWPRGGGRPPCPKEIPLIIASDYNEACIVLQDSPKASAALSRRCLQNLLREAANVRPCDLYKEIQEVIDSGKLPSDIVNIIDAVRNIGNFAAHPIKSKSSGEIVDVEPEEAELNLDVLEALFDFYFVRPEIIKKKKDALNKKLLDSGKPTI